MSFQDVGAKRRTNSAGAHRQASHAPVVGPSTPSSNSLQRTSGESTDFSSISVALLRFQREVSTLPSAVHSRASTNPHNLEKLRSRFSAASGLGEKIRKLLQDAEDKLHLVPRERSSESRTRLVKLVRDFGRLEAMLKTVELDFKKKIPTGGQLKYSSREESTFNDSAVTVDKQLQLRMEEEEKFAEEIMRQREVEVSEINKKMHQVNAIYKDLGQIVSTQQDDIDQVEVDMEAAAINAQSGLARVEQANSGQSRLPWSRSTKAPSKEEQSEDRQPSDSMCNWSGPLEEIRNDFFKMGNRVSLAFSLGRPDK